MITNLLDKTVKVKGLLYADKDTIGKICAIFGENGNGFSVAVITEDGKVHTCYASQLTIYEDRVYSVVMFWDAQRKIKAIKALRSVTQLDLKAAKELVESQPGTVRVKNNLTYAEAEEIRRILAHQEGMECEVRKEL